MVRRLNLTFFGTVHVLTGFGARAGAAPHGCHHRLLITGELTRMQLDDRYGAPRCCCSFAECSVARVYALAERP